MENTTKLRAVVSGHTHYGVDTWLYGGDTPAEGGDIELYTVGSDYRAPKYVVIEI